MQVWFYFSYKDGFVIQILCQNNEKLIGESILLFTKEYSAKPISLKLAPIWRHWPDRRIAAMLAALYHFRIDYLKRPYKFVILLLFAFKWIPKDINIELLKVYTFSASKINRKFSKTLICPSHSLLVFLFKKNKKKCLLWI